MILIIYAHTFGLDIPSNKLFSGILMALYALVAGSVMPMFMIMSGYGFRKMKPLTCLKKQSKSMLKPYLYTMIGVSLLHLFTRYLLSHSKRVALYLTLKVTGGFLLALPVNKNICGIDYICCGPMWYLIALFIGWILLNTVMYKVKEQHWNITILILVIIGWILGYFDVNFFCLSQGFISAGYLYVGYIIKKKKILQGTTIPKYWYLFVITGIFCIVSTFIMKRVDNMADGIWNLGILSILADVVLSIFILYVLLWISEYENPVLSCLASIGRCSLYIFAVHTVEMHGIPWFILQEKMQGSPIIVGILIFILRSIFIFVAVKGIIWFNSRFRRTL